MDVCSMVCWMFGFYCGLTIIGMDQASGLIAAACLRQAPAYFISKLRSFNWSAV
jgi:hypothetical protein